MNININGDRMKKLICLFLTVCLIPLYVPTATAAAIGAFDEVQLIKGDVYTIPTKGLQRVSITDPNVADISDAQA